MKTLEERIEFRIEEKNKNKLIKISKQFGLSLSDYIKRKLLDENEDLDKLEVRYISTEADKNNLLTVSVLYKTNFMVKEILAKQGYSQDEFVELEQRSLEFAREQREKHGYKILSNSDKE